MYVFGVLERTNKRDSTTIASGEQAECHCEEVSVSNTSVGLKGLQNDFCGFGEIADDRISEKHSDMPIIAEGRW